VDVGGGSPPLEVRIERRDPGNVYWWTSAPPSDPELDAEPGEEK
jgi:hypothetical protein